MQFGQHSKQALHPHGLRENLDYPDQTCSGRYLATLQNSASILFECTFAR